MRFTRTPLTTQVLVALVVGLAAGIAIASSQSPILRAIPGVVAPLGTLWVNALRMTVIPLVVSAILIGVESLPDARAVGRIGGRALVFFLIALVAAAAFAITIGPLVLSALTIDPAITASLRAATGTASQSAPDGASLGQWVAELVPSNPVKAAADGAILQLIVFALAVGIAITAIAEPSRRRFMELVHAVYHTMLTLVRWVLRVSPIGVFALTVALAAKLGATAAGAAAFYVVAVSVMILAFGALFYVAAWLIGGRGFRVFARACAPAQAVALSSRSSLASLPALIEGSEAILHLPPSVCSFLLPLSVATFRPGGAITIPMGVLFVAQLHGVHLGLHQLAMVALTAVVTTFSAPGIPGGSLLVMVPVLLSAGLPADAVGLLIGVDTVPDMARTVTNVTGDMAAAAIVTRFNRAEG